MRRSKKTNLIFFLLPLWIATNCSDNIVDPPPAVLFYPLSIGNSWDYNYQYFDSLENILDQHTIQEIIINSFVKDGAILYQYDSPLNMPGPGGIEPIYLYKHGLVGLHELILNDTVSLEGTDILLYKYPCSKNDIFTNGRNDYDTTYVVSLNDTIDCEAGTFSCIVYRNLIKDYIDSTLTRVVGYIDTYVAYGVGRIAYESFLINSKGQFYKSLFITLNNYNIN